ncbi:unnamed protein product [Rangifer tarandus platyrhynchus]|uniref:Uncharacterized protein n=1 Tax=Rangifer tarandus platyrhynchus TaxID=3082113 RepID=A0AC59ZFX5_RANTA
MPSPCLFGGEAPSRVPQQKARVRKGLCLMYELRLAILRSQLNGSAGNLQLLSCVPRSPLCGRLQSSPKADLVFVCLCM